MLLPYEVTIEVWIRVRRAWCAEIVELKMVRRRMPIIQRLGGDLSTLPC